MTISLGGGGMEGQTLWDLGAHSQREASSAGASMRGSIMFWFLKGLRGTSEEAAAEPTEDREGREKSGSVAEKLSG